jgi:cytochrome c heme-lyase
MLAGSGEGVGAEDNFRPNLAFFIDVRPALDGWEGARMRAGRWWRSWSGPGENKADAKC